MKRVKVGIIGGAGYTGGEAIRILVNHDGVELVFVHSNSNAGNLLSDVHADCWAIRICVSPESSIFRASM